MVKGKRKQISVNQEKEQNGKLHLECFYNSDIIPINI